VDSSSGVASFIGMRYAAPPVGELRWAPPQPPPRQLPVGVTPATAPGNECFQGNKANGRVNPVLNASEIPLPPLSPVNGNSLSEDCLFLNVFSPALPGYTNDDVGNGLPVIVWIHGGGYVAGSTRGYPGTDIIALTEGRPTNEKVVVVTIQYRLGLFGFLAGARIREGGGEYNVGLLDQRYALEWVQSHIAKFGGDPGKVTIWGESAGAGSVLQQVLVGPAGDSGKQLFRGAITSSTFLPSQYEHDNQIPEMWLDVVLRGAGCAQASKTAALACLRKTPSSKLAELNAALCDVGFSGTFVFVPVVDGTLIPDRPSAIIKAQRENSAAQVPLLAITNTHDGDNFVDDGLVSSLGGLNAYVENLFPTLPQAEVAKAVGMYTRADPKAGDLYRARRLHGDAIFICPSYALLNGWKERAWKGEFAVPPARHADDIRYFFTSWGNPNKAFSEIFSGSFIAHARALDPNVRPDHKYVPLWAPWTEGGRSEMVFNVTGEGKPDVWEGKSDAGLLERCRFWESVGKYTSQ